MTATQIDALPERELSVAEVGALEGEEDIRSAHPVVTLNDVTERTVEMSELPSLVVYLHVKASKYLVGFDRRERSWAVLEEVTDAVADCSADQFDQTQESLCEWVEERIDNDRYRVSEFSSVAYTFPFN